MNLKLSLTGYGRGRFTTEPSAFFESHFRRDRGLGMEVFFCQGSIRFVYIQVIVIVALTLCASSIRSFPLCSSSLDPYTRHVRNASSQRNTRLRDLSCDPYQSRLWRRMVVVNGAAIVWIQ